MKTHSPKRIILPFAALGMLSILFYNCRSGSSNNATPPANSLFSFKASYTIPADVAANASDTALAAYAWQEFLALNWKSSYGKDGKKGMPDTAWNYYTDNTPAPDTLVWETYAHRTELSPYRYPMRPFDSACNYSYKFTPQPGSGSPGFGLLNNLDETSEIGSCNLFAFADTGNFYTDSFVVRYQAKTNRIEYDYIRNTFPTYDSLKHTVKRTKAYFNARFLRPSDTIQHGEILNLPDGSIEVKTAWRQLKASEDPAMFLTRKVIVYNPQPIAGTDTFSYTNKTYALIGMHIIHKSPNHPSFVFATWEHVGVVSQDSMKYVLLNSANVQAETLGYKTPIRNPIPRIDSLATAYVHQHLLPASSVWRHYRLVGVQGTPTNDSTANNFFLANYVIESDSLLARFHGSGFGAPFNHRPNVVYLNDTFSVGGCQGCHGGGAQHSGQDFSFIVNSPNNAPDPVAAPPAQAAAMPPGATLWKNKLGSLKQRYR